MLLLAVTLVVVPNAAWAQSETALDQASPPETAPGIRFQLQGLEPVEPQSCAARFQLDNRWSQDIDFMLLELLVIDDDAFTSRLVSLAVMPLNRGEPADVQITLAPTPCSGVDRVLIENVPICRNSASDTLDCLTLLQPETDLTSPMFIR
ncbi:MAG: hypothetical protein ACPGYL_10810 [Rhodospirillaceae bacterium]